MLCRTGKSLLRQLGHANRMVEEITEMNDDFNGGGQKTKMQTKNAMEELDKRCYTGKAMFER